MKKRISLLVSIFLVIFALGCGNKEVTNIAEENYTETVETDEDEVVQDEVEIEEVVEEIKDDKAITFTDSLGREVTVDNPQRVVTL